MRILTFNLWHGLAPAVGPLVMEALEPEGRRELRERLQADVIEGLNPDLCLFQEVNPAGQRSAEFAARLRMEYCYQPDLVGVKLFGVGIPFNLNSGLVTMARRELGLRQVDAVSLSRPGRRMVHRWASWQLAEERFALFTETLLPGWGRVLVVNTHLHHGLEGTPEFSEKLLALAEQLELTASAVSDLKERVAKGNLRRQSELKRLLDTLSLFEPRYEVIVLGGDLNATPDSDVIASLREQGFRDVWAEVNPGQPGLSFDHTQNQANHLIQTKFPLSLVVEDLTFSAKAKEGLLNLARAHEARPRRIDYLFIKSRTLKLNVKRAQLVGQPGSDGLAPSDHFGVLAEVEA